MSDDLTKRQPQDKSKISLTEAWEVRYWTQTIGVTETQLRAAIRAVGNGSAAVKKYFGK